MKPPRPLAAALCILLLLFSPVAHAQGQISGRATLTLPDGTTACAEWLRVLLVCSETEVPAAPDLNALGKFEQMEALRTLHMKFFVNVRTKMSLPDYVVSSALTESDGGFRFSAVPAGTYFIVVTFPAMIRDYKVAWQIPVTVKDYETASVELNSRNLAIPTYSRQE